MIMLNLRFNFNNYKEKKGQYNSEPDNGGGQEEGY